MKKTSEFTGSPKTSLLMADCRDARSGFRTFPQQHLARFTSSCLVRAEAKLGAEFIIIGSLLC